MKIWFNHWFTTAYYYIETLKKCGYTVIGSNKRENCIYGLICDKFIIEPELHDEEYVNWCLSVCEKEHVDIFIPRLNMRDIIVHKKKFLDNGILVLCEDNLSWFDTLNSKMKTASFFKENNICNVPEYKLVNTVDEFKDAYEYLHDKYGDVCMKYDIDEGGTSFKKISIRNPSIHRIIENNGLVYSYDYLIKCLGSVDRFDDLVLMPYIQGDEVSVDCFGVSSMLISICRLKVGKRITKVYHSETLRYIVNKFYSLMPLKAPFNVQFRYIDKTPYLLEVNTRLAGGAYKDMCLEYDFAKMAVDKLIGNSIDLSVLKNGTRTISSLEGFVELDRGYSV